MNNNKIRPYRFLSFLNFFRSYLKSSMFIIASLPVFTTLFRIIPAFNVLKNLMSILASVFCFLIIAYVFFMRDTLAKYFFPVHLSPKMVQKRRKREMWHKAVNLIPLLTIGLSIFCLVQYIFELMINIDECKKVPIFANTEAKHILLKADFSQIWSPDILLITYIGFFVFTEVSFVLMALKEYYLEMLKIDEITLLKPKAYVQTN